MARQGFAAEFFEAMPNLYTIFQVLFLVLRPAVNVPRGVPQTVPGMVTKPFDAMRGLRDI